MRMSKHDPQFLRTVLSHWYFDIKMDLWRCIGKKDDQNSVILFPFIVLMAMVLLPILQVGIALVFSILSKLRMTLGTWKAAWFVFVGLVNTYLGNSTSLSQ